jgi:2-dehydro-3-deoxyphosphogluconate aldolase / (4S)-4-hydroxy-2-oxoglutarate aldolase
MVFEQIAGIAQEIRTAGVVPVVRTSSRADAQWAVQVLYDAGLRVFEITLTTPDAAAIIADLSTDRSVLVGAGTVMDLAQGDQVVAAGASFIVSPALRPELSSLCQQAAIPCVLGALTPTEVASAAQLHVQAVKIFPISAMGGVSYLKALKDVYPHVSFAPTGGIGVEHIATFLNAGADFVGVGGKLLDKAAIASRDASVLTEAAHIALGQVREAAKENGDDGQNAGFALPG